MCRWWVRNTVWVDRRADEAILVGKSDVSDVPYNFLFGFHFCVNFVAAINPASADILRSFDVLSHILLWLTDILPDDVAVSDINARIQ